MQEKSIYSDISIRTIPRMKVARYVVISPDPEEMVIGYMDRWAEKSGVLEIPGYVRRMIGWDFPYISNEQRDKFGLRGYVAALVIPDDFEPEISGAEITWIEEDTYAALTIRDPHSDSFRNIPEGFQILFEFVNSGEYKTLSWEGRIAFEEEYDRDGVHYMDIYIPVK